MARCSCRQCKDRLNVGQLPLVVDCLRARVGRHLRALDLVRYARSGVGDLDPSNTTAITRLDVLTGVRRGRARRGSGARGRRSRDRRSVARSRGRAAGWWRSWTAANWPADQAPCAAESSAAPRTSSAPGRASSSLPGLRPATGRQGAIDGSTADRRGPETRATLCQAARQ
jgi:hypothetical protein